ncbi:NADPH:quinone oxidoreductase family protein [Mycolicibacterium aubagnense]|uniref:Alcohol dehydrogenase n=1 Tax=Mycolicibacterium aubagnense TaxID=319707 RepID=A0ABN5YNR2_9MYCO|nr:NADPH:quinone oxidoreductase family protein [Mycolicibacterium aubagnense]TLH60265.1 NADPH:quinone oxidoreductase [Mycolicibacterium aubagnense]WGI34661.1 NADPH:quinone oxidoreductase family protein [Mycolicibacterium aubagnense]BBX83455.1 alcohol dehydrogenase [Mycolicibacterium aubagnense]
MKAVVCPGYGPPEVVRVDDVPAPALDTGQVRIRVNVAAVNFPDVLFIANQYQVSVPTPFVPGSEFAGIIIEVANAAGDFAVGDRVSGAALHGAFAEEVVAPAAGLTRIPDGVDDRTAAAYGVAHGTAYHALRSAAQVDAGQDLVVLGAGGGVGLAAVQLGVLLGATVTAVASSDEKLSAAASYGAVHLVKHGTSDLRGALRQAVPDGAHAVIDPVGGAVAEPALRSLRPGGRFVTVGFASGVIPRIPLNLVLVKGVHIIGFQLRDIPPGEFHRNRTELTELLTAGQVVPHVGAVFPLDDAARALRLVADGKAIGKVLIEVTS